MGEHLVVNVDQFLKPAAAEPDRVLPQPFAHLSTGKTPEMVAGSSSSTAGEHDSAAAAVVDNEEADEAAPLIGMGECRICQEEDSVRNMEYPCACSGSLKYAHRKCVQRWCIEKGDITCEICHQPYQPGYTAPPRPPPPDETIIDIGGGFLLSGTPLDLHDPRFRVRADAEHRFFEADDEDYNDPDSSSAAFGRSSALILMALLLLQRTLAITDDGDSDEDAVTFFSLIILRAIGFLLPFYIMIWAISILQRRRQQQQEASALTAAQLTIVVQAAQARGLLVASTAAPSVTSSANPHEEQPQRNDG